MPRIEKNPDKEPKKPTPKKAKEPEKEPVAPDTPPREVQEDNPDEDDQEEEEPPPQEEPVPHDRNGSLLQEGDRVMVPCIVKNVAMGAEFCNLSVETEIPMYPGPDKTTITLNTRQVELVQVEP